ncbi:GTP-binding protein [Rutstroemia sp. NJR-2017a WRK4]|nr:GTP-binding protein [Rutstroemia sp. NJR-2017a WRK4]
MASIFTYEPEPPRVNSPWLTPTDTPKQSSTPQPRSANDSTISSHISEYGVTKLEAEPQEGPTEYKLHLLLRPRRNYSSSSTGSIVSGSQQHKQQPSNQDKPSPILAPSNQSKQKRLEQLTTQLLWRLQQSSPYHASSTSDLVLPKLPGSASSLDAPTRPGKLLAGLEESRGALYEIGVSDDGTFVGLTNDEMEESLTNLRAMAASLGCNVEVVRKVVVGECEWQDTDEVSRAQHFQRIKKQKPWLAPETQTASGSFRHQEKLWVAEALITPDLSSKRAKPSSFAASPTSGYDSPQPLLNKALEEPAILSEETTEQLRITLTGPTTSGKSSLLGTLSTTTLDNGRGKSRLSLLKHRHEIATGITSSVAQELIGYKDSAIINYASGNVTSWTDIHAAAEDGRLLFVSDSAGHPRYRRTTVRGLVGWAPHWTVLCVAADDAESNGVGGTSSATEILGTAGVGIDLAKAHLELCLKLDKPLAIVITKLDLASKPSLAQTLSKLLSAIKATGRTPSILPPDQTKNIIDADLTSILPKDTDAVRKVINMMAMSDLKSVVPIVLTSAAKGSGIRQLHALLQALPIPAPPTPHDYIGMALNPEQPSCLFHIEDIFGVPASYEPLASKVGNGLDSGSVVAGHLRFGRLSIGDTVVIGPFPADNEDYDSPVSAHRSSPASFGTSLTSPSSTELAKMAARNTPAASVTKGEWHNAHIVSIRNLRLPVHTLEAGQIGTIGIVFDLPEEELSNGPFERSPPSAPRIRKGMVMAIPSRHMLETNHSLQAASGFTASFDDGDINSVTPGTVVVIYIASIRASARVLKLSPNLPSTNQNANMDDMDDVFGLGLMDKDEDGADANERERERDEPLIFGSDGITDVQFELLTCREWIELGSQVLVMPGGGHGLYAGSERGEKGVAGLEGFVGRVVEVVD